MTRRGFALLTVLWLVAALSALSASALLVAKVGADTSRNRIVLLRSEWAREACAEILLARYGQRDSIVPVATIQLGGGLWCRADIEDAGARLDLNLARPEALRALIGNDSLTDALLDWRDADSVPRPHGAELDWYAARRLRRPRNGPLADVTELRLVRGFDSTRVERLRAFLTTRGTQQVDLNLVPEEVLVTLPALTPVAINAILLRREIHRPISGPDELISILPPAARESLLARYQEFSARTAYGVSRIVVEVVGGGGQKAPLSIEHLTLVRAPGRLAVVRREVE
jgi:type II secretory pathway component PulK